MATTTVNPKGQVTIPEEIRSRYGFRPGAKVAWVERDGQVYPRPLQGLGSLKGRFKRAQGQRSLAAVLRAERRRELEREDD
jgi:AbrB family looped-hinge helix DNA binding protein